MTATTEVTPLYGFTEGGAAAHLVINPVHRIAACGRYLSYIPLTQPQEPAVCRLCVKYADPTLLANVSLPALEQVVELTGMCSHCGSDEPLNDGLVIPHGVARMRKGVVVHTPERCPGAGHAPEADQ